MTSAGVETAIQYLDLAGIIYPFRVACHSSNKYLPYRCSTVDQVPALHLLACREIVRDHKLTDAALQCIPQTLTQPLLEAAFMGKHDAAADLIIARWPYATLRLTDVFSEGLFPDLSYVPYRSTQLERLCESLSYTTGFVSGFVHYLKRSKEGPGHLKCLDITGFPTAEVVAIYLFSHCVIAINEHRQNLLWQRMLQLKAERAKLNLDNTDVAADECQIQRCSFREGQGYVARVDLRIDSESMLEQLLPCFNDTDDGGGAAKFRISIGNLFITGLCDSAVLRILQTVQLHELSGLCLAFSRLGNWPVCQLVVFLRHLGRCVNLTSLDLCNCGFDFGTKYAVSASVITARIRNSLSKLTNLRRLNLSMNKLSGKLSSIISPTLNLTHFSIDGCRLMPEDINFLGSSEFNRQRLVHLDLSHLRVNTDPAILISLKNMVTKVVWPRLSVLLLYSSRFDPSTLLIFSEAMLRHEEMKSSKSNSSSEAGCDELDVCDSEDEIDSSLITESGVGLVYLDICEESSKLDSDGLLKSFHFLFQMKRLRYLKIEYPHDCLSLDNLDGFLDLGKKTFFDNYILHIKQQYDSKVELVYNQNVMDFH